MHNNSNGVEFKQEWGDPHFIGKFLLPHGTRGAKWISFLSTNGASLILVELVDSGTITGEEADLLEAEVGGSKLTDYCPNDIVGGIDFLASLFPGLSVLVLHESREVCRDPMLNWSPPPHSWRGFSFMLEFRWN